MMILLFLMILLLLFIIYYFRLAIKFYNYFDNIDIVKDIYCYPVNNRTGYIVKLKTFNRKYHEQYVFNELKPSIKEYFYINGFICIRDTVDRLEFIIDKGN